MEVKCDRPRGYSADQQTTNRAFEEKIDYSSGVNYDFDNLEGFSTMKTVVVFQQRRLGR